MGDHPPQSIFVVLTVLHGRRQKNGSLPSLTFPAKVELTPPSHSAVNKHPFNECHVFRISVVLGGWWPHCLRCGAEAWPSVLSTRKGWCPQSLAIVKVWEQPTCPPGAERLKTLWHICGRWNTMWLVTKKKLLPFWTAWMDLEVITPNEISQSEKDK